MNIVGKGTSEVSHRITNMCETYYYYDYSKLNILEFWTERHIVLLDIVMGIISVV